MQNYPLTGLQTAMLVQAIATPTPGLDIVQVICRLHETVDPKRLQQRWSEAIRKFDGLRVAFEANFTMAPSQSVVRPFEIEIPLIDFSDLSPDDGMRALNSWLDDDRMKPFLIGNPPLFRVALIRLDLQNFVMAWTFHHITLDGRAIPLVLKEVLGDRPTPIEEEKNDRSEAPCYTDYLKWFSLRDWNQSNAFWREFLQGVPVPLALPLPEMPDRKPLGPMPWKDLGTLEQTISKIDTLGIGDQAARCGVTINTLLQAAWGLLLSRCSGSTRVCFGTIRSCRFGTVPDADKTVGLFTNAIPMVVDVPEEDSIANWLRHIYRSHLELRAYEHTPMSAIRAAADWPASSPIAESMLAVETRDLNSELRAMGPKWAGRSFEIRQHSGIPITIAVQLKDTISIRIAYDQRRFKPQAVARLLNQFAHILGNLVKDPESTHVGELSILPEEQKRHLVLGLNPETDSWSSESPPLESLWLEQCKRTPEAIAIRDRDASFTYKQLERWSHSLVGELMDRGVRSGDPVGLWLERSASGVAMIMAILRLGAYYVPLPLDAPTARLELIIANAELKIVYCDDKPVGLSEMRDTIWSQIPTTIRDRSFDVPANRNLQRLFCIIYTSGTTGVPKGVCLTHHGFLNLLLHRTRIRFRRGDFECSALTSPLHFDGSIVQMFSPLITGGTLVICGPVAELGLHSAYHELTTLTGASSLIAGLVRQYGPPRSAKAIGLGAEPIASDLLGRLLESPVFERILTGYGVTECSCYSTDLILYDRKDPKNIDASNWRPEMASRIGRPISNAQIYILDSHRRLLPLGVAGELYIGGVGVATEYLRKPEQTADHFYPDPFRPENGFQIYRTGDQGRWLEDETLEFLGRRDRQIKLHGYRIELSDIEFQILRCPAVNQAFVVVQEDRTGKKRLVAYFVTTENDTIDIREIREDLRRNLPEPMIPDSYVQLASLPLTSNGKVDLNNLPIPRESSDDELDLDSSPRNEIEQKLVAIWQEILDVERVGIRDRFFALGGDSLAAVKLILCIAQQFDRQLPLALLLTQDTIEQLSEHIARSEPPLPIGSIIPLNAIDRGPALFVMPSLFGELLFAKSIVDGIDKAFRVVGIQPNLTDAHRETWSDFERTAEQYAKLILAYQPKGPYALLGYSYGGLLAFEVARQLKKSRAEVDLLAIIDTGPESVHRTRGIRSQLLNLPSILLNLPRWIVAHCDPQSIIEIFSKLQRIAKRAFRMNIDGNQDVLAIEDVFKNQAKYVQNQEILNRCFASFQRYIPKMYDGEIILFRAETRPLLHSFAWDLGWSEFANQVHVVKVSGDHKTILLAPNANSIASDLLAKMRGNEI